MDCSYRVQKQYDSVYSKKNTLSTIYTYRYMHNIYMLRSFILVLVLCICSAHAMYEVSLNDVVSNNNHYVLTFVGDECGIRCDDWVEWTEIMSEEFPSVGFMVVDADYQIDFDVFNASIKENYEVTTIPDALFISGENTIRFQGSRTLRGMRRWLNDMVLGQFHPLFVSSDVGALNAFSNRFDASIQIMSREEPLLYGLMSDLTLVGFAWTRSHSDSVVVFIRSITGENHVISDDTWWLKKLSKYILPPVIPYEIVPRMLTQEVMAHYGRTEMHVVYDGVLSSWWDDFSRLYNNLVIIQLNSSVGEEFGLPPDTVSVYNRSIVFRYPGVDIGVVRWFHDIFHARGTPVNGTRSTWVSQEVDENVLELTGDTLHDKIVSGDNITLLLYDNNTHAQCLEVFSESNHAFKARMHTYGNDHETLPPLARAGFIFHYATGRVVNVSRCF